MANSAKTKFLIVIAGPTAVGKTDLSIKLAQHFNTEILSADSRQFFREMNIGTAKPTPAEQQNIRHHFIDSHSISEDYNAGQFEADALDILDKLYQEKDVAILVGGSGLYVRALCEGMDEMPEVAPEIREELNQKLEAEGLETLCLELEKLDPEYFAQVDKANPQRVVRALEVCLVSGRPYSYFRNQQKKQRPFRIIKIGLTRNREELYKRIDLRMDQMLAQGLLDEAKSLEQYKTHNALQTVGYTEIFDFLEGKYDWAEAVRLLKRNSRRYAKRQLTWFRKDPEFTWFEASQEKEILHFIEAEMHAGG
ncbi:tRNA (adenosine(37)-N6)-dimethylallyltransferase MiaA [Adhaeribacter sp. BT258]|uniref:tRNA dimethylallyltransferase n=1 Tax=Adhaeribacter terrigena TaxID=2793070 RepID=A0ABS1C5J5_9BACT|nr:tRNA (adenosine(37)-N6)-dimethylallyltransferase MiaA [Adhaeribacter terrigena]MBK0403938.1 tRNA (adenosine(37)-N6)-dimethylallyltransferase MiaA [Adhaeribacter terrigena]